MIRKFRPGDRVQKENGGPVMEVTKYVIDHSKLFGNQFSDHHVECVWFEKDERKKGIFDQRTLFKVTHGGALFED